MGETESECTDLPLRINPMRCCPFTSPDPRARLSSLNYELTYEPDSGFYSTPRTPLKYFPRIFTIPLDRIPSISNLTVTTCTRVCFTSWWSRRQTRTVPSSGHTLHWHWMWRYGTRGPPTGHSVFERYRGLGEYRTVVVEDCRSLAYDEALELVGMERLRSSANHLLRPVPSIGYPRRVRVNRSWSLNPISKLASNTDVDAPFKIFREEEDKYQAPTECSSPRRVVKSIQHLGR